MFAVRFKTKDMAENEFRTVEGVARLAVTNGSILLYLGTVITEAGNTVLIPVEDIDHLTTLSAGLAKHLRG